MRIRRCAFPLPAALARTRTLTPDKVYCLWKKASMRGCMTCFLVYNLGSCVFWYSAFNRSYKCPICNPNDIIVQWEPSKWKLFSTCLDTATTTFVTRIIYLLSFRITTEKRRESKKLYIYFYSNISTQKHIPNRRTSHNCLGLSIHNLPKTALTLMSSVLFILGESCMTTGRDWPITILLFLRHGKKNELNYSGR